VLAKTVKYWFAILVFSIGVTAPVRAASPTPISYCQYDITAPGNYVVTNDLTSTGTCITINTPIVGVSIDLRGHSITGNGTGYGIFCFSPGGFPCSHVIVANGTVRGFGTGIYLWGTANTVAQMTVQGSTGVNYGTPGNGTGVWLGSSPSTDSYFLNMVTNTLSTGNAAIGILVDSGSIVTGSKAYNNGGDGIQMPGGSAAVIDSEASNNRGSGIAVSLTGFVVRSTAKGNALTGIYGGAIAVSNSNASENGKDGIATNLTWSAPGSVIGSVADNNGNRGIVLTCPASAFRNVATNNPGGNLVTSDQTCNLLDNNAPPL
jgi:hypothetical protein